jgi:hypothetical protein
VEGCADRGGIGFGQDEHGRSMDYVSYSRQAG